MTTETSVISIQDELQQTWQRLWEFAVSEISWTDGTIEFSSFFNYGKELFDVTLKRDKTG